MNFFGLKLRTLSRLMSLCCFGTRASMIFGQSSGGAMCSMVHVDGCGYVVSFPTRSEYPCGTNFTSTTDLHGAERGSAVRSMASVSLITRLLIIFPCRVVQDSPSVFRQLVWLGKIQSTDGCSTLRRKKNCRCSSDIGQVQLDSIREG